MNLSICLNEYDLKVTLKSVVFEMINDSAHSGDRKRTCAFTSTACQIMNDLRKANLLCDAKIATTKNDPIDGYAEFSVHRFILAGRFANTNRKCFIFS